MWHRSNREVILRVSNGELVGWVRVRLCTVFFCSSPSILLSHDFCRKPWELHLTYSSHLFIHIFYYLFFFWMGSYYNFFILIFLFLFFYFNFFISRNTLYPHPPPSRGEGGSSDLGKILRKAKFRQV